MRVSIVAAGLHLKFRPEMAPLSIAVFLARIRGSCARSPAMCEALRDGSTAAADLGLTWEIVRLLGELGPHCMLLDVPHSPPEHGWLTVSFVTPGTSVEVDASDALNNPLQDLVTALDDVLGGNPASVRWFLEPGAFVLNLVPDGQSVALHLTLCRDSLEGNDGERALHLVGPREAILAPLCRLVRSVETGSYPSSAWPRTDVTPLQGIERRLGIT